VSARRIVVFDLDGTLLDSDDALADAFVACGVPPDQVTRGHVVADECRRLGIDLEDYLRAYDVERSRPFEGVEALLDALVASGTTWAVCSNKHPLSGRAELARLGWQPVAALFADAFDGPKRLEPVLAALGVDASEALFVGDTPHDAVCASDVACAFAWAAWNPRCTPTGHGAVLGRPRDVLDLLGLDGW
jgi:HAD superfamily hydrolase (TIGR01549 family)